MKTLDHSLTCDEILLDEVNEGRRSSLLFHGTFLLGFDLSLLGQALSFPSPRTSTSGATRRFAGTYRLPPGRAWPSVANRWPSGGSGHECHWRPGQTQVRQSGVNPSPALTMSHLC